VVCLDLSEGESGPAAAFADHGAAAELLGLPTLGACKAFIGLTNEVWWYLVSFCYACVLLVRIYRRGGLTWGDGCRLLAAGRILHARRPGHGHLASGQGCWLLVAASLL
jgi:hypothetical protein